MKSATNHSVIKLFRSTSFKTIALFLAFNMFVPTVSLALTSGPTQPEVSSFEPVGTSQMVDLFTGDFNYNIPLFELPGPDGGYPFNLAYHSGITMDQEASWVGLGWNLNPGAINRQMRGLPDEFNGTKAGATDVVKRTQDMANNVTMGASFGGNFELLVLDTDIGINLEAGVKLYGNSYRGLGIALTNGFSVFAEKNFGSSFSTKGQLGLGLSIDSQGGSTLSPSLSLGVTKGRIHNGFSLSTSINSMSGLHGLSLSYSSPIRFKKLGRLSIGGTLAFASPTITPVAQTTMTGTNVRLNFKTGFASPATLLSAAVGGFYNLTKLKNRRQEKSTPAYGYYNLHNRSEDALADFNREKDGSIRKNMRNLAMPSLTYDICNIQGQGIGGMFRAHRSDIGVIHDESNKSTIGSYGAGFDVGVGAGSVDVGLSLAYTYSATEQGKWHANNEAKGSVDFITETEDPLYEPYYLKVHGEMSSDDVGELDYIGNEEAVAFAIEKRDGFRFKDRKYKLKKDMWDKNGDALNKDFINLNPKKERESRNQLVQRVTNKLAGGHKPYAISYLALQSDGSLKDKNASTVDRSTLLDRAKRIPYERSWGEEHTAGYTVTNTQGIRYNYALPAYVKKKIDCQFSVDKHEAYDQRIYTGFSSGLFSGKEYRVTNKQSQKYYNKEEINNYPHSFLITSILGTDYVDADDIEGPSEGDFGYWVKFNYAKSAVDYMWRAPFHGANYVEGDRCVDGDDKAAYTYGEKETWYLTSTETKSHIAIFELSDRRDGFGASKEIQTEDLVGEDSPSFKIDQIKLYSKAEYKKETPTPIKTVHFDYSYDLCSGVYNNNKTSEEVNGVDINKEEGKLTLKSVYFTYKNNKRGKLSPYQFDYHEGVDAENPAYSTHLYDRWGGYKNTENSVPESEKENLTNPYIKQSNEDGTSYKEEADRNAAVWSLKEITLPSGGLMKIDYESDDYAYVQDQVANQMMKIKSFLHKDASGNVIESDEVSNTITDVISFQLEKPIPKNGKDGLTALEMLDKYFKGGDQQLYFKIRSLLIDGVEEDLSCYAKWKDKNFITSDTEFYTEAWVELDRYRKKDRSYNTLRVAGWQFIQGIHPELLNRADLDEDDEGTADWTRYIAKISSMLLVVPKLVDHFKNFYVMCQNNDYATKVKKKDGKLVHSYVRLQTPDLIKYGGGLRVKQIEVTDNWNLSTNDAEKESTYGQVYDYTTTDGNNDISYSSGVAAYEPMIGGDENPLHTIHNSYLQKIPLKKGLDHHIEKPINESFYPAPIVGYSKVTVRSLASHKAKVAKEANMAGISTTGVSINEFYTAKDYPVKSDETDLIDDKTIGLHRLMIPIPFVGVKEATSITATQGYVTILNDMHGKPKLQATGEIIDGDFSAVNEVEYFYRAARDNNNKVLHNTLGNTVPTVINLKNESGTGVDIDTRIIGQDYDFITDMRWSQAKSIDGGLSTNLIWTFPLLFAGGGMLSAGHSITESFTAVTNKIIYKRGILEKVVATDGNSIVKTENKLWDAQTGQVVLKTVTNDFDAPIYNYSQSAHLVYDKMGAAYKNIGLYFEPTSVSKITGDYYEVALTDDEKSHLVPGDEFVVGNTKAIFVAKLSGGGCKFTCEDDISGFSEGFTLIRSGRRNLLGASVGSIVSLEDPTKNWIEETCTDKVVDYITKKKIETLVTWEETKNVPRDIYEEVEVRRPTGFECYRIVRVPFSGWERVPGEPSWDSDNDVSDQNNLQGIECKKKEDIISTELRYVRTVYETVTETKTKIEVTFEYPLKTYSYVPPIAYKQNKVLAISAATFSDSWMIDYNNIEQTETTRNHTIEDGFVTGERGIWRAYENYAYVDQRTQKTDLELALDGQLEDVKMFDWENPFFTECAPKWRRATTVTKYNENSYPVEERNALDIYSSSLYGYNGRLPIAVAANAQQNEIAFESFEEETGSRNSVGTMPTNNFEFYTSSNQSAEVVKTKSFKVISGNNNLLLVNGDYEELKDITEVKVSGALFSDFTNKSISGTYSCTVKKHPDNGNDDKCVIELSGFDYFSSQVSGTEEVLWAGDIVVSTKKQVDVDVSNIYVSVSESKAHTGSRSMKLLYTGHKSEQARLNIKGGESFYMSCWTASDLENYPDLRTNSTGTDASTEEVRYISAPKVLLLFKNKEGVLLDTKELELEGYAIEGWQKMALEFIVPTNTSYMQISLNGMGSSTEKGGSSTPEYSYFDDFRIHPSDASMQTYVYDNTDYKLQAVLDDNNYATFYYYDEEGKLYLVKKETERGIRTLQESFSHIKE